MQVFRKKLRNEKGKEIPPFHLIASKGWEPSHTISQSVTGEITKLPSKSRFRVTLFCGRDEYVDGDTYETLNRQKHEKKVCEDCIKGFKKKKP